MGLKKIIRLIRHHWLVPVIVAAAAHGAHLAFEVLGGPTLHVAEATVAVDLGSLGEIPEARAVLDEISRLEGADFAELAGQAARLLVDEGAPRDLIGGGATEQALASVHAEHREAWIARDDPESLARELVESTRLQAAPDGPGDLEIRAEVPSEDGASLYAWLVARALADRLQGELVESIDGALAVARERESELEAEWKAAIQERLEFSRELGVVDIDRQEELLRRMILDIDEEIGRHELERLEVARLINELQVSHASHEEEARARVFLDAEERERTREELLQARLEYQVQATTLTRRHPKMVRLQRRILELETRLLEEEEIGAETGAVDGETRPGVARRDDEVVEKYRLLSLRLNALEKKRAAHVREFKHLNQVRPDLARVEKKVSLAAGRLDPVRTVIANFAWFREHAPEVVAVTPPAITLEIPRGGTGPPWRWAVTGIGALLGILGLILYFALDTRLRAEKDIVALLELPILARIPRMGRAERADPEAVSRKGVPLARRGVREGFKTAATILRTVARELDFKVFSVTSTHAGEGKSTAVIHLAVSLARKGMRVAVVDADLRNPCLHDLLELDNDSGLTTLLEGGILQRQVERDGKTMEEVAIADPADPGVVEGLLQCAFFENLFVLPAGPVREHSEAAVNGAPMRDALRSLASRFDVVLVDTPAMKREGEALELVGLSDCCVLVIGAGQCDGRNALWAKQLVENVQTSILGVVLNRYAGEIEIVSSRKSPEKKRRESQTVAAGSA